MRWSSSPTGTHGTLTFNSDGSYVYTLTSPFDTSPDADDGANTEKKVAESFTYVVTDADGNTATGTITVNIVDDIPTATADANSVVEGAIVTGNVLTDDPTMCSGRTVRRRGSGRRGDWRCGGQHGSAGVWRGRAPINGSFGELTLNANGTYSYDGNPDVGAACGRDGNVRLHHHRRRRRHLDGDADDHADEQHTGGVDDDLTVNEAALGDSQHSVEHGGDGERDGDGQRDGTGDAP